MILDDDTNSIQLISDLLTDAGYEVHAFSHPGVAWEKLPFLKPDCLVLDLSMPMLDGREFLPWARKIFPDLAIIICSGLKVHDESVFKEYSIQQRIQKPISAQQLIEAIEKALSQKKS